jgi:hypothetical protein
MENIFYRSIRKPKSFRYALVDDLPIDDVQTEEKSRVFFGCSFESFVGEV